MNGGHARAARDQALKLLDGPGLDMPDPLAADAELARQIFKRQRLLGKTARREDRASRSCNCCIAFFS